MREYQVGGGTARAMVVEKGVVMLKRGPRTTVLGHFQPSLRDWSALIMVPRTGVLGYSQPSLTGLVPIRFESCFFQQALRTGRSRTVYPTQAQRTGLTPIFCHAVLERSACAPFIKERRMKCINATNLRRKSGQWGTQRYRRFREKGLRADSYEERICGIQQMRSWGCAPSFSAQVRWCEPGAPVLFLLTLLVG
jgi:hypothetical protein